MNVINHNVSKEVLDRFPTMDVLNNCKRSILTDIAEHMEFNKTYIVDITNTEHEAYHEIQVKFKEISK